MGKPTVIKDVSATKNFDFLYGSFRLSKWEIPYFATTISLKDAANDLRLTYEIPGVENIEWNLDELYQRDIDWPRVERQIVPYLRNASIPQFFNSITIALLPYDTGRGRLADRFDSDIEWNPPDLADSGNFAKTINVGPVAVGTWNDWESPNDDGFRSGRIRWNTDEVFGVAIDGQHRLAAIKALAQTSGASSNVKTSRVPVIFLLFDEAVGFRSPTNPPTVELLRALFIDLNKHAQSVKRGRQILLDDRDPHAVCVRTLIAERLSDRADSMHASPPRLPLSLVDWHSEQAKFDSGPYLCTVLGLDWIVIRTLDTKPISDWTDYVAIAKQISRLESQLGIQLLSARQRLNELHNLQMSSFAYLDSDLDAITSAFGDVWREPIINLLTRFEPYADLIKQRDADQSYSMQYQQWFLLYAASCREGVTGGHATTEYQQFQQRVALDDKNAKSENDFLKVLRAQESAKSGAGLAFNVVFQRALVESFLEYCKFGDAAVGELSLEEDADDVDFGDLAFDDRYDFSEDQSVEDHFTEAAIRDISTGVGNPESRLKAQYQSRSLEFVRAMNRFFNRMPELFDANEEFINSDDVGVKFWLGSFLKAEGGIDFTLGASNRAKDILFIISAMCIFDEIREPNKESNFVEFWEYCQDPAAGAVCKKVGRVLKRMSNNDASLGGRILRSSGRSHDAWAALDEVRQRLCHVWKGMGL